MRVRLTGRRAWAGAAAALTLTAGVGVVASASASASASTPTRAAATTTATHRACPARHRAVSVQVLTPRRGDRAGAGGKGWVVDLAVDYPGGAAGLTRSGFTGPQLTGPAAHASTAPFPGTFSTGRDDHLPGLVVLVSTTSGTLPGFAGPGTNLANLFNVTSLIDHTARVTRIGDTWIVGAPIAGMNTEVTLRVAVVGDTNHDGIFNDAPAVVPDANHDGRIDAADLKALGLVSSIDTVHFFLNGTS